jgi:MOSC domain-containing protein YiiM
MAFVAHLFRAVKRGSPMAEVDAADVVTDFGFANCRHARKSSKRQVLLVDQETLDAMDLPPGVIRENITTQGLNVNGLAVGEQLRLGSVLLEVSMVCTPCDELEKVRRGLRREIYGRRGMLCRVLEGGTLRPGDTIERLVNSQSATPATLATAATDASPLQK